MDDVRVMYCTEDRLEIQIENIYHVLADSPLQITQLRKVLDWFHAAHKGEILRISSHVIIVKL